MKKNLIFLSKEFCDVTMACEDKQKVTKKYK